MDLLEVTFGGETRGAEHVDTLVARLLTASSDPSTGERVSNSPTRP